jgi:hypothetical protein
VKTRAFLVPIVLMLAVALAGIAAGQLNQKTLAVLAGAVCGVGAAIPTGLVVNSVIRHRATARKDRAAWCEAQAELSELRAWRLETLALRLPTLRHQLVVHAHLERRIAHALREGNLDRALELIRSAPELPGGITVSGERRQHDHLLDATVGV